MVQGTSFITPARVTQLSELRSRCSGSPSLLLHAVQVPRKPTRRRVRSTLSCDGGSYGGFDGGLARDRAVALHNRRRAMGRRRALPRCRPLFVLPPPPGTFLALAGAA